MKIIKLNNDISLIDPAPPIPGLEDFIGVYVIQAKKTALIDVGPTTAVENLLGALREIKIQPAEVAYILCTHIHLDHTGGLGGIIKYLPEAQVVVHEKGLQHLANPSRLWEGSLKVLGQMARDYGPPEPIPEDRLITARENMTINLGDKQIEILLTPGHAPHHLSFIDRQRGWLFPGEAAGIYFPDLGMSRPASPAPFDLNQAFSSIDKLLDNNPQEIYFSHFGYAPDAKKHLRRFKKELAGWSKIIACEPDNADLSEIVDKVLTQHKIKEIIYRLPPERLKTELFFIRNSISGIKDYFKREGTSILEELED